MNKLEARDATKEANKACNIQMLDCHLYLMVK
jgi:hypothetical protein